VPEVLTRLPRESETTIFRLVQECLTNVHRHSGSPTVHISVREVSDDLIIEIRDRGHGMKDPLSGRLGVGIMGMQERVKQAGGRMKIQSYEHGTTVIAALPVVRSAPVSSEDARS
jgi:signal transduction histidine kinase